MEKNLNLCDFCLTNCDLDAAKANSNKDLLSPPEENLESTVLSSDKLLLLESEPNFLDVIRDRVQETIDQVANESGIDLTYYKFQLKVDIMASDFYTKVDEKVLIGKDQTFCSFCGTPTLMYIQAKDLFVCAKCYNEVV